MTPSVSILMPFFNTGKHLEAAISSILSQSFRDFELILINDGSNDGCDFIVSKYVDSRIRYFNFKRNKGLAYRLNQGIKLSKGRYIARMDADDVSFPERLEVQIDFMELNKKIDLLSSRVVLIDEMGEKLGLYPFAEYHSDICKNPIRGFYMPHPTWFCRTEWIKRHKYCYPAPYCSEDQELLFRTYQNSVFHSIKTPLLYYRVGALFSRRKYIKTQYAIFKFKNHYYITHREYRKSFVLMCSVAVKIIFSLLR